MGFSGRQYAPGNNYPAGHGTISPDGHLLAGHIRSIHTGQPARSLTLRTVAPGTYLLQEVSNQLVVSDNQYDDFGSTYRRQ